MLNPAYDATTDCYDYPDCGHAGSDYCSMFPDWTPINPALEFQCELCGAAPFQPCDRWCWAEVDEYADRHVLVLTGGELDAL